MKLQSTLIGFSLIASSFACNQNNSNSQDDSQSDENTTIEQQQVETQSNSSPPQTDNGEISDNDLLVFASVNLKVQEINQEAQADMIEVVEENGMDVDRYSQILQAEQSPEVQSDATAEEKAKFDAIAAEIQTMQEQFQSKIDAYLTENNISEAEMQQLAMQIQSDSTLMQRYIMLQQAQSQTN